MSRYEYRATKYEHIGFWVEKGTRAKYRLVATAIGWGQSEMIRQAIDEFIARHATEIRGELNPAQQAQIIDALPQLTRDEKHLVDAFKNLSPEAQKALLKFLDALQS
ncbi:MAG: hypothetical protein IKP64_02115 [Selenomonadaceae bacterium]|nr:hypothetical protein [Selenomonadaceae bacterium]